MTRREAWHLIVTFVLAAVVLHQVRAANQAAERLMDDELTINELDSQIRALRNAPSGDQRIYNPNPPPKVTLENRTDRPITVNAHLIGDLSSGLGTFTEITLGTDNGWLANSRYLGLPKPDGTVPVIASGEIHFAPPGYTIRCAKCGAHSP